MKARLIHAASEGSANLFHATRFFAPDPFLFLQEPENGPTHLCTSALEVDRARRTARVDHVHDWADIRTQAKAILPQRVLDDIDLMAFFLKQSGIHEAEVPSTFPFGLANELKKLGIDLIPLPDPFWPQRAIKTAEEIGHIQGALEITARGMNVGIDMIRRATVAPDASLHLEGAPLTSERVRGEINAHLVREGAMPNHTIVAGGPQGADPHEEGHGPLFAHTPIILDVFPRIGATGFWGDMTRTVCRGSPPERVQRAWDAVLQGQEVAFSLIRDGVSGKAVHAAVTQHLTAAGFPTGPLPDGRQGGFFHGTGHGLGLEIHEPPSISGKDHVLTTGNVITVEPGLYYPDMGGVRIEDVVVVEKEGCRNLTTQAKFLVL
ncbi:MAG: aminopeptidase P family protein [Magnetococcales bacterium]|nr:aminopeptidase P family protein [Magnetococcales bacterium]